MSILEQVRLDYQSKHGEMINLLHSAMESKTDEVIISENFNQLRNMNAQLDELLK